MSVNPTIGSIASDANKSRFRFHYARGSIEKNVELKVAGCDRPISSRRISNVLLSYFISFVLKYLLSDCSSTL